MVTLSILGVFVFGKQSDPAGDIVEYFGITESLKNHYSIELAPEDKDSLSQSLNPEYFQDPGYYIQGRDGNRYPVHFFFYSLLSAPVRFVLHILNVNELNSLRVTNILLFSLTIFVVMYTFIQSSFKRLVFLITMYASPLLWFLAWPGPDIYYVCLTLLSLFLFFRNRYSLSALCLILASWHSQPLIILAIAAIVYDIAKKVSTPVENEKRHLAAPIKNIGVSMGLGILLLVPYIYNLLAFGVLTPWTIFADGWTKLNGFGLQNASLKKLFEQFFDLDIGLFWYAPFLAVGGFYALARSIQTTKQKSLIILGSILVTAFFYQTNPAWNYGTSGYGPTRHILFVVPFLIYFLIDHFEYRAKHIAILVFSVLLALPGLYLNGFLFPQFEKTLYHNPIATAVLNRFPRWYNPTPEIFEDRTLHTDTTNPRTAMYKNNGKCVKAYVLLDDSGILKKECGFIPKQYKKAFAKEELRKKTSYPRTIQTTEATFWPDSASCGVDYVTSKDHPFVCMKTLGDVIKYTGIIDIERFTTLPDFPYPGIWKLKSGDPVKLIIPPGYLVDYRSLEGIYVDY